MVLTPFNQDAIDDPKVREEQVQSIPWKRAAQPSEIGRLAVFLASSDADYVTDSSYYMDGGLMQNQGQGASPLANGESARSCHARSSQKTYAHSGLDARSRL
jgi:hypothetical protein